jgi:hypothetical protein
MRTPILLGANPKTAKTSAWVPVRYERWKLVAEGLIDTKLALRHQVPETGEETVIRNGLANGGLDIKEFNGICIVKIDVEEAGTENVISVFAEEIV